MEAEAAVRRVPVDRGDRRALRRAVDDVDEPPVIRDRDRDVHRQAAMPDGVRDEFPVCQQQHVDIVIVHALGQGHRLDMPTE
jgi:hypothetical protein